MNQILTYDVENAIREPGKQCAPNTRNHLRVKQRNLLQSLQLKFER
jgi:hypothetical protein